MPQVIFHICTSEQMELIWEGLQSMRRGHFFDAHEQFERGFREGPPPARILFGGLAQLAASHHQLILGRGRAAARTWQKARAKLEVVGALTKEFSEQVDRFHARLGVSSDGPRFVGVDLLGPPERFPVPDFA